MSKSKCIRVYIDSLTHAIDTVEGFNRSEVGVITEGLCLLIDLCQENIRSWEDGEPNEDVDNEKKTLEMFGTKNELGQFFWIDYCLAAVTGVDVIKRIMIIYTNSDWLEAMSKRGIEDLSLVHVEPWVAGRRPEGMSANARAVSAIFFLHKELEDNHYARPVEGLIAHVDLDSDQVIIEDHGVVPIPEDDGEYAANRCLLYTSPSPRDKRQSRMPSSA